MEHPYSDKGYPLHPPPLHPGGPLHPAHLHPPPPYWSKFAEPLIHTYDELLLREPSGARQVHPPIPRPETSTSNHHLPRPEWPRAHLPPQRLQLPHTPVNESRREQNQYSEPDYPREPTVQKPTEEAQPKVSVKEEMEEAKPVKKQTHQAIREALSKRGMVLSSMERPWENHTRRNSLDGPSSSQPSPGTSGGSPLPHLDKSSDPEADCHKKRPQMSYMQLIQLALNSVQEKRMNLQQIYSWIEQHFPFFRLYARKGWKNSVRHNLSLYDIFVREKPDPNDEWKFSYWCLRPENAVNGLPNSASKRDQDRHEKMVVEGKKPGVGGRGTAFVNGLPEVNDYVVAVPPSMQQSGSRPLLPRSSQDTLAVIPLDYMYQLPPSQTGNFVCAQATSVPNPNFTGTSYDSSHAGAGQSDSGYISLNGSVLPVFPGQSFSAAPEPYKLPDNVPKPRNIAKEATKRASAGDGSPKKARKSRKSLPMQDKVLKKTKKRTKSAPIALESKENAFNPLEINDHINNDADFSSPLRMLLLSPPQGGNYTSTPFKDKPLGTLRVTPIKSVPKGQQSTPKAILDCAFFSPERKEKLGDVSILSNRSFNLSIPGLTPLKDKENHGDTGNVSMNDSLGRLLSDFQYDDNLLDCGVLPIDMDIANGSFLHMTPGGSQQTSPTGSTASSGTLRTPPTASRGSEERRTLQQL